MKRELFAHFSLWLVFFLLVTLVRRTFSLDYWIFYLGGIVGTFLVDIDHLLYIYLLRPQELTSQRLNELVVKKDVVRAYSLLSETRTERKNLIFHTSLFQIIFLALTFWILTSSGNLFCKGVVLAFSLHLCIDQLIDLKEMDSLDNWFSQLKSIPLFQNISADKARSTLYSLTGLIITLFFAFFL